VPPPEILTPRSTKHGSSRNHGEDPHCRPHEEADLGRDAQRRGLSELSRGLRAGSLLPLQAPETGGRPAGTGQPPWLLHRAADRNHRDHGKPVHRGRKEPEDGHLGRRQLGRLVRPGDESRRLRRRHLPWRERRTSLPAPGERQGGTRPGRRLVGIGYQRPGRPRQGAVRQEGRAGLDRAPRRTHATVELHHQRQGSGRRSQRVGPPVAADSGR